MSPKWTNRDSIFAFSTFLLACMLYARTVSFDFVNVDDNLYVYANPEVQRGLTWEGVTYAFTSVSEGNYLPLTWLSLMAGVEIGGTGAGVQHAINLVLHAIVAALLFVFLRLSTGYGGRSFVVAVLFAVHPLRVESVAWIAERKDVLSGVFWMLGLLAYCWYALRESWWRYAAVAGAFACGLLSKSMVVTFPCVLLLLDVWPLRRVEFGASDAGRRAGRLALEKLPLILLSVAASVVAIESQRGVGAVSDVEAWGLGPRIAGAAAGYGAYLHSTVWPVNLAVFYPTPESGVDLALAAAGGVLVVGISVGAIVARARLPYLFVGWFWFVGTLVPVIGLVRVGLQSHADRYTYLPHMGLMFAVVWGIGDLLARRGIPRWIPGTVAAAACSILAALSWNQVGYWRNSETLFRHALAVTGENGFAEGNYAVALIERGAFEEAEVHLQAALRLGGSDFRELYNLGLLRRAQGRWDESLEAFRDVIDLRPRHRDAWLMIGEISMARADVLEAIAAYTNAQRIDPDSYLARINLGIAYGMAGDDANARAVLEPLAREWPDDPDVLYNLALLELKAGEYSLARTLLERLVSLDPENAEGWYYLAACEVQDGEFDAARDKLGRAITLDATLGDVWRADRRFEGLRRRGLAPSV